jgi:hypothetical protein
MHRPATPATEYLDVISQRIGGIRREVPKLTEMGEQMAGHLLAGGNIFVPAVSPYWASEFTGRAGGLMGIATGDYAGPYVPTSDNDVAFTTLPRKWSEKTRRAWSALAETPARIFVIGDEGESQARGDGAATFTGLGEGSHAASNIRPFEELVRGWIVTGELISACTRAGRMPHIWMSVWLEGALVRNASFFKHDNLREPWKVPVFHERIYVPPMEAGHVAGEFLRELERIHGVLVGQAKVLGRASKWIQDAKRAGRKVSMVAVGHAYPEILEADENELPVSWSKSISDVSRAHPAELGEGDVAIHLGYAPVEAAHVGELLARKVKFVYSSPYGPRDLPEHANLIWLEMPWRPADATVDVPGYSVRILPMSSSVHTMAYFAMLAGL